MMVSMQSLLADERTDRVNGAGLLAAQFAAGGGNRGGKGDKDERMHRNLHAG